MKCFVTGGAGYIGSNLVDRLLKDGHEVTVYDNMSSGEENFIKHHFSNKKFKLIKEDLLERDKIVKSLKGHDIVFHLAANPDVFAGLKNPDLDFYNGTVITFNVLDAMRLTGVKKIVFASSGTVYGFTSEKIAGEDVGPILPISLYGGSKVAAEAIISGFAHIFEFTAYIFRFGNAVGKRQNHGVIADFIKNLRENPKELHILGDGKQTKPYIWVGDILDAIFFVLENAKDRINYYNVCTHSHTDVDGVAKRVIEGMGLKDVKISYSGGKQGWKGDAPLLLMSSKKINKLGWKAKYTSDQAVELTIKTLLKDIGYKK